MANQPNQPNQNPGQRNAQEDKNKDMKAKPGDKDSQQGSQSKKY